MEENEEYAVSDEFQEQSDVELEKLYATNARLDQEVFDLSALLKAGAALHDELEVDALCRLLLAMCKERTQIEQMAILLYDQEEGCVKVVRTEGLPAEASELSFPIVDGILWRLLRAGEPFSVVDLRGAQRFPNIFGANGLEGLNAQFWIPLMMSSDFIGVLSLGLSGSGMPVSTHEVNFLRSLGSQAAVAINRAGLYQRVTLAHKKLDRSLHQLSLLFDVTRAPGAVSDLTRLIRLILERAIAAVDAEKGSLMLLDDIADELVVRVVFGLPDKEIERRINLGEIPCRRLKRGEGVAGWVLQTGEVVCVNNTESETSFTDAKDSYASSILCVPLKVEDETIGVINITNRISDGDFVQEDEDILCALADQAAVAIARARLYEAAITDGLTSLYVRRFVIHRLGEELRRAKRYGQCLTVVMCDIDYFKKVNDTWGHQAGDTVLVKIAEIMKGQLRSDVDIAGRYGGEEFLIVLPETPLRGGLLAVERLRSVIESTAISLSPVIGSTGCLEAEDQTIRVSMSFGLAQFDSENGEDVESLIGRADAALYESKSAGRNRATAHTLPDGDTGSEGYFCVRDSQTGDAETAETAETAEHDDADSQRA